MGGWGLDEAYAKFGNRGEHMTANQGAKPKKKKLEPIPCDCKKCTNWLGSKKGCRLLIQDKIKDGKCLHFGTYVTNGYNLTKEEKAAIREHNRAVEAARPDPNQIPVVKLARIQQICEGSYITMDYLRRCKTRFRPGNARYEIECIKEDPLTVKIKGMKGPRKTYIIEE